MDLVVLVEVLEDWVEGLEVMGELAEAQEEPVEVSGTQGEQEQGNLVKQALAQGH